MKSIIFTLLLLQIGCTRGELKRSTAPSKRRGQSRANVRENFSNKVKKVPESLSSSYKGDAKPPTEVNSVDGRYFAQKFRYKDQVYELKLLYNTSVWHWKIAVANAIGVDVPLALDFEGLEYRKFGSKSLSKLKPAEVIDVSKHRACTGGSGPVYFGSESGLYPNKKNKEAEREKVFVEKQLPLVGCTVRQVLVAAVEKLLSDSQGLRKLIREHVFDLAIVSKDPLQTEILLLNFLKIKKMRRKGSFKVNLPEKGKFYIIL